MKLDLGTAANVATLVACAFIVYVALGARTGALPLTEPRRGSPVEEMRDVTTPLTNLHLKGNPSARTVVIEFTDFQCPFCGQHARSTFPAVQKELIDKGTVLYAVRHFPLDDIHPMAADAAKAALCAGEQQRYWPMHERLFALQQELTVQAMTAAADQLGLVRPQFEACMSAQALQLEADRAEAKRLGIYSTPTFLVGNRIDDGDVQVKVKVRGASSFETLRDVIANAVSVN